jgi:hypothetical protein
MVVVRIAETDLIEDGAEYGCSIVSEFFKVAGKGANLPRLERHQRAVISSHALARHYQRCADQRDAALLEDLRVLAMSDLHDRALFPIDQQFRIATPRGDWVGCTCLVTYDGRECSCLNVRSFLD